MSSSNTLKAIVAISENSVIGKNGDLPWRISEDLKWFKKITLGHTLINGQKNMGISRVLCQKEKIGFSVQRFNQITQRFGYSKKFKMHWMLLKIGHYS